MQEGGLRARVIVDFFFAGNGEDAFQPGVGLHLVAHRPARTLDFKEALEGAVGKQDCGLRRVFFPHGGGLLRLQLLFQVPNGIRSPTDKAQEKGEIFRRPANQVAFVRQGVGMQRADKRLITRRTAGDDCDIVPAWLESPYVAVDARRQVAQAINGF
ncbi:hypothetical protein [Agrobacterium sp. P15N1-A]|uniref:hypothetical protein n=1 Tax=Agrobacterium sp. P15N1-A TaxID=3342820 RepID=UPI0037DC7374